ncbi:MAG: 23S rRNA (uracil-C(5))-methyltransferase RlmCD [Chlamydiales bacterium]|nr:23S rRNA (uracil-C(5))-methyltransferase RlmCD [Chlamydiales bacterium]MCH9635350.1 23S rRNA (uracil-C(5))-methyltransferase RlmCD [Chlamydiales bacterium]MCH9704059.1 23S rRNA (uracil(1939)-C(5))-methyltransferase RlmD [Chlamydiota bacterium]
MTFCDELTTARCQHFGSCGGCTLQKVSYDFQLEQKEEMIRNLFPDCSIEPILGCEDEWGWRNKMEFSFSQDKAGERFLGLMMRKKRGRVVTLEECHITQPWFIETLQEVYDWWGSHDIEAYFPPADRGQLRTLMLREGVNTGQKMAVLTVAGHDPIPDFDLDLDSVILRRQIIQKGVPTRFEEELISGTPYIEELLGDYRFRIYPSTFFQPNTVQAQRLYDKIAELVEGDTLLDLYCGTGSIGIFCSSLVKRVIGMEIVPGAQENIDLNGVQNMEVQIADVEKQEELPDADCVIVDPPRAGLGKAVEKLQKFKRIIYVSCNPRSQARDIAKFDSHQVTFLQPVDQFPQTPHVENIALLERH